MAKVELLEKRGRMSWREGGQYPTADIIWNEWTSNEEGLLNEGGEGTKDGRGF